MMEVYTGAAFYGCENSMVITNRHFTRPAIHLSSRVGVQLWDREALSTNLVLKIHKILDYETNRPNLSIKNLMIMLDDVKSPLKPISKKNFDIEYLIALFRRLGGL